MNALIDPSRYFRPLLDAQWSPIILEQFFNKVTGKERPFLRLRGVLPQELSVRSGEIVGVHAEDETILHYLTGFKRSAPGSMLIREGSAFDQVDYRVWPYQVGYAGEKPSLYPELTVEQNWKHFAQHYGLTSSEREMRIRALSQQLGLGPYLQVPVYQLPSGVQRFADLGCAMLHEPKLLCVADPSALLPEPLVNYYYSVLHQERSKGNSVVVVGQHAEVLQKVSDRVIMGKQLETTPHLLAQPLLPAP